MPCVGLVSFGWVLVMLKHDTVVDAKLSIFSKTKDFSRSQPVTYIENVVISGKWCQTELLLLQSTNRKWYMAYRIRAIPMTSSHFHSYCKPFKCDFFVQLCSSWQDFNWRSSSHSSFAAAELLVVWAIDGLRLSYLLKEQYEDAVADCTKALEFNPDYMKALLRRAELYEKTDKLDEALEDYTKALERDCSLHVARAACMVKYRSSSVLTVSFA